MGIERTDSLSFRKKIAPGERKTFKFILEGKCTIERVKVTFYEGQESALQVRPYLLHATGSIEELVRYAPGTEEYISGNAEPYDQPVTLKGDLDDAVCIEVYNESDEYEYKLTSDVVVDYYGGDSKVVGGLR